MQNDSINWGDLNRVSPFSENFGFDRPGGPVDRVYIERFLESHKYTIRGAVLEIKDNTYTTRFGGSNVIKSDVLDINPKNTKATITADITDPNCIRHNMYDCVILTQILQFIYDFDSAIETAFNILRKGGVLLITVPGITQIAYDKLGNTWYWSFSEASINKMLSQQFGEGNTLVASYGNVRTAAAFLYGAGAEELSRSDYDLNDKDYQVIIAGMAVK